MHKHLIVFVLATPACDNDYKFDDSGGDWEDDEPVVSSECYTQTHADAQNIYDLDTGSPYYDEFWETCYTQDAFASGHVFKDTYITGVEIHGYDDVVPPGEVHFFALRADDAGVFGWWPDDAYYLAPKYATEGIVPDPTAWDWMTLWSSGVDSTGFSELNDCYPVCNWYFGSEIIDTDVADANECEESYDDNDEYKTAHEGVEVCVQYTFGTYPPAVPPSVGCTAGSGEFQLIPTVWQDWNQDGLRTVQWRPIQKTGTGALTGAANVTSIKIVDDHDVPVKVIHKDKLYNFDTDDKLAMSGRGGSTLLSDTTTKKFTSSQLRGDLHFVSEDVPKGKPLPEAKVAWTCPPASTAAGTPPPVETLPQGYVTSLASLGCGDYKQKIVARPVLFGEQTGTVSVELYGVPHAVISTNVRFEDDRWYFNYDRRGWEAEGSFAVETGGLDVDLDYLAYKGVGVCDIGHYVFPKEG